MIGILELFNLHIKLDLSFNATAAPPPPGSQIDNNEFLCNKNGHRTSQVSQLVATIMPNAT